MLQRYVFTENIDDLKTGSLLLIEILEKTGNSIQNLLKGLLKIVYKYNYFYK